ncbi:MAG: hybrid sensor histidine kinase/response regulator [Alkalispirochaeta sp.]
MKASDPGGCTDSELSLVALVQKVDRVVNEARNFEAAVRAVVELGARALPCVYTEAWVPNEAADALVFSDIYTIADDSYAPFGLASREYSFEPGVGLPGLAWSYGRVVWFDDVSTDERFVRKNLAARFNLGAGFSVAVPDNERPEIPAVVLVFFLNAPRNRTSELSIVADALGAQFSVALSRKRVEDRLLHLHRSALDQRRARDSLLQNLNHELRTPLTSILGITQRLQDSAIGEVHAELGTILDSAERMRSALDAIDRFARLVRPDLVESPADPGIIFRDLVHLYGTAAHRRGIKFYARFGHEKGMLGVDMSELMQTLRYLLDNAIRFTSEGSITFTTELHTVQAKRWLRITISDTGIGMNTDEQALSLQPFRQGSEGLNRTSEGLGLGLTLAREMVHSMSGHLSIRSVPGDGTTVTVELPEFGPVAEPNKSGESTGGDTFPDRIDSVLVVEDNAINAMVMESTLSREHVAVVVAKNGEEAIAAYREHTPQLVLMDINLGPGIDGIQAMKEIRLIARSALRIVAVTGYSGETERSRFLREGFDDFLSKPFRQEQLTAFIR